MPNALSSATSPYLRQHADNPVDWLPWGEAAFERARRENKPLFLSIGYATCHWCHVMAHECFEDEAIAAQLNRDFVCVKVDREERPDVDRVYMAYVQARTGHGGWPLTVFLTPERRPFFGGTYFAPQDAHGRPGLPTLLAAVCHAWTTRRQELDEEGARVVEMLSRAAPSASPDTLSSPELISPVLERAWSSAWAHFNEYFDSNSGGFGGAPKFPQPSNLLFLLRFSRCSDDSSVSTEALRMVVRTLEGMARGGIHDHVGGGFHRYSVDDSWFVPHFEKMLYDQAQLASLAAALALATGSPLASALVSDILRYCLRDLATPAGVFCAAEDADSPVNRFPGAVSREGAFYVWTLAELRRLLPDAELAAAVSMFSLQEGGNVPAELDPHGELSGANILALPASDGELASRLGLTSASLTALRSRLLATLHSARAARPRPLRDGKVVASWNGLMLSALAAATLLPAQPADTSLPSAHIPSLSPDEALAAATRCAGSALELLWDVPSRRLHRSWCEGARGPLAVCADYVCLIRGLLDLHQVSLEPRWLDSALELQASLDLLFWDEAAGAYFDSSSEATDLIARLRDDHDGAEPSPSALAAHNLLRLAALFDRTDLHQRALRILASLLPSLERAPHAHPSALLALEWALAWPPRLVVFCAAAEDPALLAAARSLARESGPPTVCLAVGPDGFGNSLSRGRPWLEAIADRFPLEGGVLRYVCDKGVCSAPEPLHF